MSNTREVPVEDLGLKENLGLKETEVLVLRDVMADMSSKNGFIWPEIGYVEAPDWMPTEECGNGLHGHLWGAGGDYLISEGAGRYLVVKVEVVNG